MLAAFALLACSSSDDNGTGGQGPGSGGGNTGGATQGGGGEGGEGLSAPTRMAVTVERYGYRFDVETGAATSTVTALVQEAGNCIALPSTIEATGTTLDGQLAVAVHDGSTLEACGPWAEAGAIATLVSEQTVPEQTFLGLDVGLSRGSNTFGGNFTYLLSWVGGCDRFGPCDDRPDQLVQFDFEVTHPAGTTALCPGNRSVLSPTSTRCTLDTTLAPTYSAFAVVADDTWQATPLSSGGGVDVVFYEAPAGGLAAAIDPTAVTTFLDWITGVLGPYPYGDTIRVATGPTAWLGFEHPANIVLRHDLQLLGLPFGDPPLHVLMHEIIHQWAGDHTTLAAVADFVWKEAICEYLAYVFEDENAAPAVAAATRAYWDGIAPGAQHHPRPLEEPTPEVETFYGDVYGPGPMVLFLQLEPALGRATILQAIGTFLGEPGAAGVDDLRAALESASGQDLSAWFDAWVYGTGVPTWPSLSASQVQTGDQVTVTVEQVQSGTPKGGVVEVDVVGANATVRAQVDFGLSPVDATASTTVTLADPVMSLVVDPAHRIIDVVANAQIAPVTVWPF
jgi:aminopeptidase N